MKIDKGLLKFKFSTGKIPSGADFSTLIDTLSEEEEIIALNSSVTEVSEALESMRKEVVLLRENSTLNENSIVSQLTSTVSDMEADIYDLQEYLQTLIFNNDLSRFTQKVSDIEDSVDELYTMIENGNFDVELDVSIFEESIQTLEDSIVNLFGLINTMTNDILELKTKTESHGQDIATIKEGVRLTNNEVVALKAKDAELELKFNSADTSIQNIGNLVITLQEDVINATDKLDVTIERLDYNDLFVTNLVTAIDSGNAEIVELKSDNLELIENISRINIALEDKATEIAELKAKDVEIDEEIELIKTSIQSIQGEGVSIGENVVTELQANIQKNIQDISLLNESIETNKNNITSINGTIQSINEVVETANNHIDDNTNSINQTIQVVEVINDKINGNTDSINQTVQTIQSINESVIELVEKTSNIDNTSDLNKPVSYETKEALSKKIDSSEKGVPNGIALLNSEGQVVDSEGNLVKGSGGFEGGYVSSINGKTGDILIETNSAEDISMIKEQILYMKILNELEGRSTGNDAGYWWSSLLNTDDISVIENLAISSQGSHGAIEHYNGKTGTISWEKHEIGFVAEGLKYYQDREISSMVNVFKANKKGDRRISIRDYSVTMKEVE